VCYLWSARACGNVDNDGEPALQVPAMCTCPRLMCGKHFPADPPFTFAVKLSTVERPTGASCAWLAGASPTGSEHRSVQPMAGLLNLRRGCATVPHGEIVGLLVTTARVVACTRPTGSRAMGGRRHNWPTCPRAPCAPTQLPAARIGDPAAPISSDSAARASQSWRQIQLTSVKLCIHIRNPAWSCACAMPSIRHVPTLNRIWINSWHSSTSELGHAAGWALANAFVMKLGQSAFSLASKLALTNSRSSSGTSATLPEVL
jgi:hypothetical protein